MAHSKVPKFGAWESEEDMGYTVRFETVRKGNPGGPIRNPNEVQPSQSKPKQKQPEFGAWGDGEEEEVPYTQYFENKGKAKPSPPREPQMNYNMGPKVQPAKVVQGSEYKRPINAGESRVIAQGVKFVEANKQSPLHHGAAGKGGRGAHVAPRQRPQTTADPSPNRGRGGGGGTIPVFGDWNANPSQAETYTVVFKQLQDDRRNGVVSSVETTPSRSTYSSAQKHNKQGGCFSWLFK